MEAIGDYLDDQTVLEVASLVKEYEDLFPQSFTKLKGIQGDIREMKISLMKSR